MKKALLFIAVITLLCSTMPQAWGLTGYLNSGGTNPNGRIYVNITNNAAIIVAPNPGSGLPWNGYYEYQPAGDIIIPAYVTYNGFSYAVTKIDEGAFYGCEQITSVQMPNTITEISSSAFRYCSGITSLEIPISVKEIGHSAFEYCSGITSITVPDSVTSIGYSAFNISTLDTLLVSSGNSVFDSRNNCNAIIHTQTNTLVHGCRATVIPNTVTAIGNHAFFGNYGLVSINIPNSVTSIGNSAFGLCGNLTSANIPNSVVSIGSAAFQSCGGLTSLTIPSSVTSIGNGAFSGCRGLTSIVVDASNTNYDSRGNCNAIIETATNTLIVASSNTIIPNTVTTIGTSAFADYSNLTSIIIPNSVTTIGDGAFSGCLGLNSVTIPNSVTYIGHSAFYGCRGLISVTIPNSVTYIGSYAFYDILNIVYSGDASGRPWGAHHINGITDGDFIFSSATEDTLIAYIGTGGSVTIPNSVTNIGLRSFAFCSGLTSVTIPKSVTSIEKTAFFQCTGLTSVTFNAEDCALVGENSMNYNGAYYINIRPFSGTNITSFTFGDSVRVISAELCAYMRGVNSITIPQSVIAIGDSAFYNCSGLSSVIFNATNCTSSGNTIDERPFWGCPITSFTFGDSVGNIPDYLCYGLNRLSTITIPEGVTSIGNQAFSNCSNLTTVNYNATNCSTISTSAFSGCNGFTTLNVGDNVHSLPTSFFQDNTSITSLTLGSSLNSIGINAFSGCTGLTAVLIPDATQTIGQSAFSNCTALATVVVGNGVSNLQSNVFNGCNHLTNLTLGSGVQSIAADAFSGCNAVLRMNVRAEVPPASPSNPFADFNTGIPVMVPCNSVTAYQNAPYWGFFTNISGQFYSFTVTPQDPSMGFVTITTQPNCENHQAQFSATAYDGFRFVRWNDGNTSNPRSLVVNSDTELLAIFEANTQGIENINDSEVHVYADGHNIHIIGVGEQNVTVYAIDGRIVASVANATEQPTISVPAVGVYMVKVGNLPARKIVVVR